VSYSFRFRVSRYATVFKLGDIISVADVADIVDITPPVRYSFEERIEARQELSKSPFFLVLGLGVELGAEANLLPETFCTCSEPSLVNS
jgi:hypothetical protein